MEEPKYPSTVSEAVNLLMEILKEDDKLTLRNSQEDDLIFFHMSLGVWIRNNFGLWDKNNEKKTLLMQSANAKHEDDVSSVIILELWKKLKLDTSYPEYGTKK